MKLWIAALTTLLIATASFAQTTSSAMASLEASFAPVQAEYLDRVTGHILDTTETREFLIGHGLRPGDIIPETLRVNRVFNVNHSVDDEENSLPGMHTATLRFRADMVSGDESHNDKPDLFFVVVFAEQMGQWEKIGSTVILDIERFLPPQDMRYAMRPFSRAFAETLNDLPDYP